MNLVLLLPHNFLPGDRRWSFTNCRSS